MTCNTIIIIIINWILLAKSLYLYLFIIYLSIYIITHSCINIYVIIPHHIIIIVNTHYLLPSHCHFTTIDKNMKDLFILRVILCMRNELYNDHTFIHPAPDLYKVKFWGKQLDEERVYYAKSSADVSLRSKCVSLLLLVLTCLSF